MLTGRPLKSGTQFKSFGNTTSGWGSGQSLDQYLVGKLAPNTTFPSLQIGVHVRDTEVRARISYAGADQPIPPREDPKDVFAALFGMTTGTAARPIRRWRACGRSARASSTRTTPRPTRLKGLVGADGPRQAGRAPGRDARRREAAGRHDRHRHEDAAASPAPSQPTLADVDLKNDDLYLQAGQLQMDLAVAALACDQTRILTFQWSYSESEHLFSFLNISGNHHAISHDFSSSGANYDAYNKIQTWYAQQFALLPRQDGRVSRKATGTLLDNSIVLWATEIGESTQHDLPHDALRAGGQRGRQDPPGPPARLQQQQARQQPDAGVDRPGDGRHDLTSFGDASGATGPLPGLA